MASITKDIVLFDKDSIHMEERACGQDDQVLVGQRNVRLQMEVHTPQQVVTEGCQGRVAE
ncbi:hypothetical protein E4U17_002902 [Claviceps sp. LM77 group G4]|nr:hypothetical protein E4U17_002902 [Claviceps sp. LM77 group G4]KAG6082150.1 hypothetical protein E4U16_006524 [Claviceps sp. LM84 group G4]